MSHPRSCAVLAVFVALAAPAKAGPCDALVADVMAATGATFERSSRSGKNAFLSHPLMDSFTLDCTFPLQPLVSGYWSKNAFPPNAFFEAVATAASVVTKEGANRIEAGMRQCNRTALSRPQSEMSAVKVGLANIECHSFTRDGGSVGFSINLIDRRR